MPKNLSGHWVNEGRRLTSAKRQVCKIEFHGKLLKASEMVLSKV